MQPLQSPSQASKAPVQQPSMALKAPGQVPLRQEKPWGSQYRQQPHHKQGQERGRRQGCQRRKLKGRLLRWWLLLRNHFTGRSWCASPRRRRQGCWRRWGLQPRSCWPVGRAGRRLKAGRQPRAELRPEAGVQLMAGRHLTPVQCLRPVQCLKAGLQSRVPVRWRWLQRSGPSQAACRSGRRLRRWQLCCRDLCQREWRWKLQQRPRLPLQLEWG